MKIVKIAGIIVGVVLLLGLVVVHAFERSTKKAYKKFLTHGEEAGLFKVCHETLDHPAYIIGGNTASNKALVGSHGSPGSADFMTTYFSDSRIAASMQIVSYDRPGYGMADDRPQANHLQAEAEYLHDIIAELSADTIVFLGHSYGCSVILRYLADYDDRKHGAVLIGSPIDPALEKGHGWRKVIDSKVVRWMVPKSLRRCNAEILPLKQELKLLAPDLKKITAPIIFYHGQQDKLVPVENIRFFEQHANPIVPHDYVVVPDDGHFIIWTRQDEVVDLIFDVVK